MFKSLPKPMQAWSGIQWSFAALAAALILFLLFGSINQAVGPQDQSGFSILDGESFLLLTIIAFIGGLLSFISPCTLPILPAYFAFAFQSGRRQIALNTVAFMFGLATMFSLLGASASLVGNLLGQNRQLLILFGGSMVIVFGVMSLLGNGFSGIQQEETTRKTTLGGSYLFGITFAIGWSGCIGPILGAVATMAATTSVLQGALLLFIYALGLGLPLLIVSTLFGKASRKSLLWRILRGKGWQIETSVIALIAIWGIALWRILVAAVKYLYFSDFDTMDLYSNSYEYGLLALALGIAAIWFFTSKKGWRVQLDLHSTQLFSGVLFIGFGIFMLSGNLTQFNNIVPIWLFEWFSGIEELIITRLKGA